MSNENYVANVIWIDDIPNDEILDNAANERIYLEHFHYVDAGMAALQNPNRPWHAVIFDAKCKIHSEDEIDNLDALTEGITQLRKIAPDMPWFVLTAGDFEGEGAIKHIVGHNQRRPWDLNDKRFYTKFRDHPLLWQDIKATLPFIPLYSTWIKYHKAFGFYSKPDLVELLYQYDNDGEAFDRSETFLHSVRLILDTLFKRFNECGLLAIPFEGSNLAECSKQLGLAEMQTIVPRYIQRCLHLCVDCCNPGSHRETDEVQPTLKHVTNGRAPYLNRTVMLCLLDVLCWCNLLSTDEEAIERRKLEVASILEYRNTRHTYGN